MNEQKITPVLSGNERMQLWTPYRDFPVGWIGDYASDIEQAVLARVDAVRDQALEEAAAECDAAAMRHEQATGREGNDADISLRATAWQISVIGRRIRALKGTPAAAVADAQPSSNPGPLAPGRVVWPQGREAGRIGDMAPRGESHMRVGLDADNDVYVAVFGTSHGEMVMGDIEFCTPGIGGGKSPRTREALIALMVAMEADDKESPYGAHPAIAAGKEGASHG